MELEICSSKGNTIMKLNGVKPGTKVKELKKRISMSGGPQENRIMLKMSPQGKGLKDDEVLDSQGAGCKIFLKDLGPQIGWSTVFLTEYAGPLIVYLWLYSRPWLFYGDDAKAHQYSSTVHIAAACWSLHYVKRILETLFVHRFSHATMPLRNLFKNSTYYWGFAAYVSYHVNHPLYTSPSNIQVYVGLVCFMLSEVGNLSIHLLLKDLRPPGSNVRKIPYPNSNPFTQMFKYVSCPNYTYEFYAWFSFALMTQCLPAALFAFAGFYQMAVWALGKHRNYKKEFEKYPRSRKAIIPMLI